jgi:CheY-like chemotaxis protein
MMRTQHSAGVPLPPTELILLVEDEPMVRSVIRRILERNGYAVLDAGSGEEGLRICEERGREIQLLLTDMIMPGMTGTELARRAAPLCPNAQVLCMSGYTDDEVFRRGLLDGHTAFVQKPFTAEALVSKVRAVLDRPASSAA